MVGAGSRRLFVGLKPPPEIGERLAREVARVLAPHDFRLYAGCDLHLTLVFLGDVLATAQEGLVRSLRAELAGAAGFRARIAETGAFPRRGRERVLWAGLDCSAEDRGRLIDLVRRAQRAVQAAGLTFDAREAPEAFLAHMTLARPRPGARTPAAFYDLRFDLPWDAVEVGLLESAREPSPQGRYPALELFPLAVSR